MSNDIGNRHSTCAKAIGTGSSQWSWRGARGRGAYQNGSLVASLGDTYRLLMALVDLSLRYMRAVLSAWAPNSLSQDERNVLLREILAETLRRTRMTVWGDVNALSQVLSSLKIMRSEVRRLGISPSHRLMKSEMVSIFCGEQKEIGDHALAMSNPVIVADLKAMSR